MHYHNNKSLTSHPRRLPALLGLMTLGGLAVQPAAADFLGDSDLDLKLRNEYRHADRPSAKPPLGPGVDAWVQTFLLDYRSGKLAETVGAEAGFYRVEKLRADPDKSTRAYLDGHDSFDLTTAALTLDFGDLAQFKVGRFGTDYRYGSLEYPVPLVHRYSQRTVPSLTEGALWRGDIGDLHLYGLYSRAHAGGYKTEWVDETTSLDGLAIGEWREDEEPSYSLAGVWDKSPLLATLGIRHKQDHSTEYMGEVQRTFEFEDDHRLEAKGKLYYADMQGATVSRLKETSRLDNTHVATGQLTYSYDDTRLLASLGHVGNKLDGWTQIDTDLTYPFDLSIGRNHHDMLSGQVGAFQSITPTTTLGAALVVTRGYESHREEVEIEGVGLNLAVFHTIPAGPLEGLKISAFFNRAQEYREGSELGDKLDYYDIKIKTEYAFDIL